MRALRAVDLAVITHIAMGSRAFSLRPGTWNFPLKNLVNNLLDRAAPGSDATGC